MVTITGLPAGANASVVVSGPNAFVKTLTVSQTLSNLTPGAYTVAANDTAGLGFDFHGTPAGSLTNVTAGATANASVAYVAITGKLQVGVLGLPNGVSGSVLVSGPSGYSQIVTADTTLTNLAPGTYSISASDTLTSGMTFQGSPSGTPVSVVAGATANASVAYAAITGVLHITISGLANGASADITVTGPNGYSANLSATATLQDLAPGTYSFTATNVNDGSNFNVGTPSSPVTVSAGTVANGTVTYASWKGIRQIGGPGTDYGRGVAVDATGNVYVAGDSTGAFDSHASSGLQDLFLVKYDPAGVKAWSTQIGTVASDFVTGVVVDGNGNAYVSGFSFGKLGGNIGAGGWDAFLMKFDSAGLPQWTQLIGTPQSDFGYGVAVSAAGDAYLVGTSGGNFDGKTNSGFEDAFLVKFNSDGQKQWSVLLGTAQIDNGFAVALDSTGSTVALAGSTEGNLGGTNQGQRDIFVEAFDSTGNPVWPEPSHLGSAGTDTVTSVAFDISGNIFVAGYTDGGLDGNINQGARDQFFTKFDSSGNKLFTDQIGTTSDDLAFGIAVDSSGNVYLDGYTAGNLSGTSSGLDDATLVKFDNLGSQFWRRQIGGGAFDRGFALALDADGNPFVAGFSTGTLPGNSSAGGTDTFVLKYDPSGVLQ